MIKKLRNCFDVRTFVITFGIFFIWILVSDYVVNTFLSTESAQLAQYLKGFLFVFIISVILSVVHGRERRVYREREEDFDRLFRETITPTLLVDVNTNEVIEANHAALDLMNESQESVSKKPLKKIFSDLQDWKHLLLEIATTRRGQAQFDGQLQTKGNKTLDLELKVSHFHFGKRDTYLIFFQRREVESEFEVGEGEAVVSAPRGEGVVASLRS